MRIVRKPCAPSRTPRRDMSQTSNNFDAVLQIIPTEQSLCEMYGENLRMNNIIRRLRPIARLADAERGGSDTRRRSFKSAIVTKGK